ncbi:DNA translocase FtsK 4TM domain-containing protein [Candidatus Curculioniphilus buchneri]|uniref:DNA translocase FtsK 4TM domain-containing protein n=1 Tax=Candidatus Curculioniphilus buchneri TaxID=690594 RepID=UPI00376ED2D7
MDRKYLENENLFLKKFRKKFQWLKVMFLVKVNFFSIFLIISLTSFSPLDPCWSQTAWHDSIDNLGGKVGAWLADILLFSFGVLAYGIPLIMLIFFWREFLQPISVNFFDLSLKLIGSQILLLSSCGLATLNIDDIYHFDSGGFVGILLCHAILEWLNDIDAAIYIFLLIWVVGLTLFTNCSWLTMIEIIGSKVLHYLTIIFFDNRHNKANNNFRTFVEQRDDIFTYNSHY